MHDNEHAYGSYQSANASEESAFDEQENNSAQALFAIKEADNEMIKCHDAFIKALETTSRKIEQPVRNVSVAIYRAICTIEAENYGQLFLAKRETKKSHGNTKNIYYRYVSAFTKGAHPLLRNRLCKHAEVMAFARHENVPSDNFPDWLKTHPIEKACAEYRRIKREEYKSEELRRFTDAVVDRESEPDKAPLCRATPLTPGTRGLKLAVLEFAGDGCGDFYLLAILPHNADEVKRVVLASAAEATNERTK